VEFLDLIAGYGLTQHVSCATHDAGGTLDVVYTRSHLATPTAQTSSRPTCGHLLYVMIDVGKVCTVTHWVSSTMT